MTKTISQSLVPLVGMHPVIVAFPGQTLLFMCGSRLGQGVRTPLENCKAIWFISNTGPDPLENHNAPKLVFNVGPLSACQRTMAFHGGQMMASF